MMTSALLPSSMWSRTFYTATSAARLSISGRFATDLALNASVDPPMGTPVAPLERLVPQLVGHMPATKWHPIRR